MCEHPPVLEFTEADFNTCGWESALHSSVPHASVQNVPTSVPIARSVVSSGRKMPKIPGARATRSPDSGAHG